MDWLSLALLIPFHNFTPTKTTSMNRILTTLLFSSLSFISLAQESAIGENVQETIPAFGYCIMPDNMTFLVLEADYDGEYITERELIDLFETSRFEFSKDLVNWTYYSYWALNERTFEQPEAHTFYQMVVDPTGTYLALAKERRNAWGRTIMIYNKNSQVKVDEFDMLTTNESIDFLNQVKFNKDGSELIMGANDQGIYSYSIKDKSIKELHAPFTYQFYDYDYVNGTPILKQYDKVKGDEYVLDSDLFKLSGDIKTVISLPLPLHYTRILTPTETHKYYGLFYEQEYDTYITPIDDYNDQVIYRNKKTFVFITREVPKE
ncbi:hypothetical protein MNBD_BACTEROID06-821 [hydrothermal vent metagenome]|uniref:Uncharacterized protein n=1 Tax=hydrothermal vent metagenome TaxID=652676 RepID=A0A3B0UCE6_9ZZZZ